MLPSNCMAIGTATHYYAQTYFSSVQLRKPNTDITAERHWSTYRCCHSDISYCSCLVTEYRVRSINRSNHSLLIAVHSCGTSFASRVCHLHELQDQEDIAVHTARAIQLDNSLVKRYHLQNPELLQLHRCTDVGRKARHSNTPVIVCVCACV